MVIDAHNHFWQYTEAKYPWINNQMDVLKKAYLPHDLQILAKESSVNGCVAVQAQENEEDNDFLLNLAEGSQFIRGVVGWIDMLHTGTADRLEYYSRFSKMKGFRYVLEDKKDRGLMLHPNFKKNIGCLKAYDFTYDILIFNDQLVFANELVKQFSNQKFVIDHLAKPSIELNEISEWEKDIRRIAEYENTYCKISGMVTEAKWDNHKYLDFVPYLETILEAFGTKRLMFGSDWPVCLLAADYKYVIELCRNFISTLSKSEQDDIMGNNAIIFYNI